MKNSASLPFFTRFHWSALCLYAVCKAWYVKNRRKLKLVSMPPPAQAGSSVDTMEGYVLRTIDGWLRVFYKFTGRRCFIRSYALCWLLRKLGRETIINIGMRNIQNGRFKDGHCWLTSPEGDPLFEDRDPSNEYPELMGTSTNGVLFRLGK